MQKCTMFKATTLEGVMKLINDELELQNKAGKTVHVQSSHQLQIGEADSKAVQMVNGQPHVTIYFVIILFYSLANTLETFPH